MLNAKGYIARRAILNAGDDLQQVRGALLVERAYWLVTCEIITSGPRSSRCALSLRLVPRAALFLRRWKFLGLGIPTMDFVVDVAPDELGNCTRKTFWSTQKRPGRKSSE